MEFTHSGLRRFWERDDASRINPGQLERISSILDDLSAAGRPEQMSNPGYRLHQLTGNRRGVWSVRVSANWRITFRLKAAKRLILILRTIIRGHMTARNPTHPSVSLQTGLDEMGWSVEEFADNLGVSRDDIVRLMDGQCGLSPVVALALERIGWSDADFWMRRQANYDLAQAAGRWKPKAALPISRQRPQTSEFR